MDWSRFLRFDAALALLTLIGLSTYAGFAGRSLTDPDEGSYAVLNDELEPFRSAFNDASDQARAVLLVGPT